jgi:hypothetical protein
MFFESGEHARRVMEPKEDQVFEENEFDFKAIFYIFSFQVEFVLVKL